MRVQRTHERFDPIATQLGQFTAFGKSVDDKLTRKPARDRKQAADDDRNRRDELF